MKKKVFAFLILLFAFFALVSVGSFSDGLVFAADEEITEEEQHDINAALSGVPSNAIMSFPVAQTSVYGNEITWSVSENDGVIVYEDEPGWMVIDRSKVTGEKAEITITVSVNGKTGTKVVTVPAGKTASRSFTIEYILDEGTNPENVKTSYKLGEASFDLPSPTKEGYMFVGWKDGDNNEIINKIYVGSMKNYTLTAQWVEVQIESLEVVKGESFKSTYTALESFDKTGLTINAVYNNGEKEDVTNAVEFNKGVLHYGDNVVVVSYSGKSANIDITVNKATFDLSQISIADVTVPYDGEAHSVAISGTLPDGVTAVYSENNSLSEVGEVKVTVSFTHNSNDYEAIDTVLTATLKVTPKTVTLSPKVANVTTNFGVDVTWTLEDFNVSGLVGNDVLSGTLTYKYFSGDEEVTDLVAGTYDVKFSGLSNNNYTVVIEDCKLTVVVADVYFVAQEYTYNGQNQTLVVKAFNSSHEEISDGIISYSESNVKKDAGEYTFDVTLVHPTYGTVSKENVLIEIKKANLTITLDSKTKVYGEDDPALTYSVVGYKDGELTLTPTREVGENVGEYAISVEYTNNNYNISINKDAKLSITPAPLTITINNLEKEYGEKDPVFAYTVTGAKFEDSITCELTRESGENVGKYEISTTLENANYDVTINKGILEIKPANLTITLNSQTKVYGDDDPTLTYSVVGYKDGELKLTPTRVEGENVGTYAISVEYTNANYNVTITDNKPVLTITKADLIITLNSYTKTYGEDDPEFEFTANSLKNNDVISVKPTRVEGENVGEYAISLAYTNDNYNITINNAKLTINPLDISNSAVVTVLGSDFNLDATNGEAITPSVEVMLGENSITTYSLAYTNNNVVTNEATITVTFNGNYTGTREVKFAISQYGQATIDGEALVNQVGVISEFTKTLPTEINDSKITWSSNTTAVTVDENGNVNIIQTANPANVELTAYITYGETSSDIRVFTFTVSALENKVSNNVTASNVSSALTFEATAIEDEDLANYVIGDQYENIAGYDLTFTNGNEEVSELNSPATIKIPVPQGYGQEQLQVWHIVGEEKEAVEFEIVEGYIVFNASSFSPYIVTIKATFYSVSANCNNEQGSVSLSAETVKALQTVTLTVEPKEGYKVLSVVVNGEELELNDTNVYELTITKNTVILVEFEQEVVEQLKLATFEFGENGEPVHKDGSEIKEETKFENGEYELTISSYSKVYSNAFDALGNSTLKLGTGDSIAKFSFDVPEEVKSVVIYVANYKEYSSSITCNGNIYELTEKSNFGCYQAIIIETTNNKTVSFESGTSGDERCMINTIEYYNYVVGEIANQEPNAEYKIDLVYNALNKPTEGIKHSSSFTLNTSSIFEDVEVLWESDSEAIIISGDTANVVQQDSDVDVTLTLTISCGDAKKTWTIEVIVAAKESSEPDSGESDGEEVTCVTFNFGANGTATHVDGNSLGTSKTYTEGDCTLKLTDMANVYGPAYDAKGNSAIKLGASSKAGSFSFTVAADVNEVIIYVAKYKANTTKINVNGTDHTLTKNSNDGAYDAIKIDTTTNKTISFKTLSGGYRCMIDKIEFYK